VIEAVFAREKSLSTGLKYGLAVPHGAVDCVQDIVAAMGTTKGIPFESVDDKPARLVVLLVIPRGSFQRHVRTLAGVSRLATIPELRERLLSASSAADIIEVLQSQESA
jgi:mannitol/fructose-specific phosphotransferase system IIA component (Ntr-type)